MKQQTPYESLKHDFVTKLNRYLQHKNVLSRNSKYYRQPTIAASIGHCNRTFAFALQNCGTFSLDKICEFVRSNKTLLRNILPAYNNASYQSSCTNLEQIIAFAEGYKK